VAPNTAVLTITTCGGGAGTGSSALRVQAYEDARASETRGECAGSAGAGGATSGVPSGGGSSGACHSLSLVAPAPGALLLYVAPTATDAVAGALYLFVAATCAPGWGAGGAGCGGMLGSDVYVDATAGALAGGGVFGKFSAATSSSALFPELPYRLAGVALPLPAPADFPLTNKLLVATVCASATAPRPSVWVVSAPRAGSVGGGAAVAAQDGGAARLAGGAVPAAGAAVGQLCSTITVPLGGLGLPPGGGTLVALIGPPTTVQPYSPAAESLAGANGTCVVTFDVGLSWALAVLIASPTGTPPPRSRSLTPSATPTPSPGPLFMLQLELGMSQRQLLNAPAGAALPGAALRSDYAAFLGRQGWTGALADVKVSRVAVFIAGVPSSTIEQAELACVNSACTRLRALAEGRRRLPSADDAPILVDMEATQLGLNVDAAKQALALLCNNTSSFLGAFPLFNGALSAQGVALTSVSLLATSPNKIGASDASTAGGTGMDTIIIAGAGGGGALLLLVAAWFACRSKACAWREAVIASEATAAAEAATEAAAAEKAAEAASAEAAAEAAAA
jgi:hypothetical protein